MSCKISHVSKSCLTFPRLGIVAACLAVVVGTSTCAVAQKDKDKEKERLLRTDDGWQIPITYYESKKKKDAAVVVLLHMKGGNRLVWQNGFAQRMNNLGYAVITVDLRHHGRAKSPQDLLNALGQANKGKAANAKGDLKKADFQSMVTQDLEAVKKFIYEEHQKKMLNMRKLAIVAPEMSAPIALNYTVLDWSKRPHPDGANDRLRTPRGQDVQAIVLISPDSSCPGVSTTPALMKNIKRAPISFLVCVGEKDTRDKKQARRLFDQMGGKIKKKGDERGKFYQAYPVKLRGTDLLGKNLRTEAHILGFLEKYLNKLDTEWRNRQSKLTR